MGLSRSPFNIIFARIGNQLWLAPNGAGELEEGDHPLGRHHTDNQTQQGTRGKDLSQVNSNESTRNDPNSEMSCQRNMFWQKEGQNEQTR